MAYCRYKYMYMYMYVILIPCSASVVVSVCPISVMAVVEWREGKVGL